MAKILTIDVPDMELVEEIRQFIGVGSSDTIEIVTPQFDRSKTDPIPGIAPGSTKEWDNLRTLSTVALKEMGLSVWDKKDDGTTLMLFPGEWYSHIPENFMVVDLNSFDFGSCEPEEFHAGETDNDIRFGCLAFGLVVKQ